MNDPKHYLNEAEESMQLAVDFLDEALAHIRAGKANPKILDGVRVDYYGSQCPISNVANISVPDARTITITPWEKAMFKVIEKLLSTHLLASLQRIMAKLSAWLFHLSPRTAVNNLLSNRRVKLKMLR